MKTEREETVLARHLGCSKFKGNGKEEEPAEQMVRKSRWVEEKPTEHDTAAELKKVVQGGD